MTSPGVELFASPISTNAPDALFPRRDKHPVQPKGITSPPARPIQTNKFYSNLYLASQGQGVWTLPYLLWVDQNPQSWGLSISHTDDKQFAFGPPVAGADTARYWISPLGIKSLGFSATEFNAGSIITTSEHKEYSVELSLYANAAAQRSGTKRILSNLVLGMGFVTAKYYDLTPVLMSSVMFLTLEKGVAGRTGLDKWKVTLEDRAIWLIYVSSDGGTSLNLRIENNRRIVANRNFSGFIQITKLPTPAAERTIDSTAGAYPTSSILTASLSNDGTSAAYQFTHIREGQNNAGGVLMYALPHHVASFEATTTGQRVQRDIQLQTPTKGKATAVISNQWRIIESVLPSKWATWLPSTGVGLSDATRKKLIDQVARKELEVDVFAGRSTDSMYFSGKALARYAQLVLVACDVLKDQDLTRRSLERLKAAMNQFSTNKQRFGLVYETTWKGIVSDAVFQTGDQMSDFGNGNYNDHHFHYGYHIYTAAVIGHVERTINAGKLDWVEQNKNWVNTLIRDVANPSDRDQYFPVSRCFDWWHGHSWAKGVFESADGKDQESTSEDYNYAYAQRLWGMIIGDRAIEGRGLLMLSIMKRAFNMYFLLDDSNTVQPKAFIKNKVTGILFENKVDHATYFGLNEEYIHGIHMLPITPISSFIRQPSFCRQEWVAKFQGRTSSINSGWRGVLMANTALFDPRGCWQFFAQDGFNNQWLDDGATRTWYLTMAAGLMPPDTSQTVLATVAVPSMAPETAPVVPSNPQVVMGVSSQGGSTAQNQTATTAQKGGFSLFGWIRKRLLFRG